MALTLVRHTTPDVTPGTCYGRTDLPLAGSFETEAEAVLASLPPVGRIVTSPLYRCRRLAERIASRQGAELDVSEACIEMDFGAWEGRLWSELPRAELDGWAADFMGYRGHGGESVAQLLTRVRAGLAALPPGTLVVTHSGVIKAALAARGDADGWEHQPPFGGIVRV
ncbi:alpha-ribazole phosphatase family protein [Aestuariicoccus sp. MJ-SS9]|uniref:alpha-ribazole phosphatase family protein n=1 Tax=Aestuariicoccus sp. MJ-SS9 TaxID=3079855 RepID=UPI0029152CA5|nr:alpha-ribazole phosphatase family protein [Aestuariicoccus sp. MJ-SS9]MDU8911236.1 alpha-ribazole phosphatase family protein [Aestuariicoccus sp. MJ-SS9]